jgi:hypothetical protein
MNELGPLYRERCGKQIDHLSQYFRLMGTTGVGKAKLTVSAAARPVYGALHVFASTDPPGPKPQNRR